MVSWIYFPSNGDAGQPRQMFDRKEGLQPRGSESISPCGNIKIEKYFFQIANLAAGVLNDLHFDARDETVLPVRLTRGAGSVQQDMLSGTEILGCHLLTFLLNPNINSGQSAGVERNKENIRIVDVDLISIR